MPIRVSRTVAKYIIEQVDKRVSLLERALVELHDLDNRMKMELVALNTMLGADDDYCELNPDEYNPKIAADESIHQEEQQQEQEQIQEPTCYENLYELVDLNYNLSDFVDSMNRADEQILAAHYSNYSENKDVTKFDITQRTSRTFNFLSGLINDTSMKMSSNPNISTKKMPSVDMDTSDSEND